MRAKGAEWAGWESSGKGAWQLHLCGGCTAMPQFEDNEVAMGSDRENNKADDTRSTEAKWKGQGVLHRSVRMQSVLSELP